MRITGRLLSTLAVATVMTVGLVGAGQAQNATPTAGGAETSPGYPNHLHLGTCDKLDPKPAVTLADLHFPEWVGALTGETGGNSKVVLPDPKDFGNPPIPAAVATTEVPMALADILSGGYGLNVHDAADPSIYIACGNVGGVPDDRGDLFIGLAEQNDSGFAGVAWLHDNGGSSTTIVVFLTHPAAQPDVEAGLAALIAAAPTEAATPAGAAATPVATTEATPVT
jgi:hypothetical protein